MRANSRLICMMIFFCQIWHCKMHPRGLRKSQNSCSVSKYFIWYKMGVEATSVKFVLWSMNYWIQTRLPLLYNLQYRVLLLGIPKARRSAPTLTPPDGSRRIKRSRATPRPRAPSHPRSPVLSRPTLGCGLCLAWPSGADFVSPYPCGACSVSPDP